MTRTYWVYMLASGRHGTLYIGITNDLGRRTYEHRTDAVKGFTSRYGVHRLVWYESYENVTEAIAREKQLKHWNRDWKIRLIEEFNPDWSDLYPTLTCERRPIHGHVMPAEAGIHNRCWQQDEHRRWLWILAFARMTSEGVREDHRGGCPSRGHARLR